MFVGVVSLTQMLNVCGWCCLVISDVMLNVCVCCLVISDVMLNVCGCCLVISDFMLNLCVCVVSLSQLPVVEIWVIILRCACISDKIPYKDIKRFDFVLMFLTFCQRFTIEKFVVRWGGGEG